MYLLCTFFKCALRGNLSGQGERGSASHKRKRRMEEKKGREGVDKNIFQIILKLITNPSDLITHVHDFYTPLAFFISLCFYNLVNLRSLLKSTKWLCG